MAKVQIKSEKITPFGGIFHVRELFSRYVGPVIDKVLGLRCTSYGYQYSEIAGSLSSVYFCGGDCVEDVTSHLMPHLSLHPTLRTCSSDTILRGISELATVNTTYTSDTGKSYYLTLPLQNNCSLPVNLLIISDFSRQFHICYFYFASTNPLLIIYLVSTTPKTIGPPFVPKPGM